MTKAVLTNIAEVQSFASPNPSILKEKHKGTKRSSRGTLITLPDSGALEPVDPSLSHVGAGTPPMAHQQRTAIQHGEVGDLEAFLEGPSGQRAGFSQGTPPPEEDVAGSTPCIDNGTASRGHTRCVKCGNNKNPSAKLQCTHCGAFLREQTKARVAQRWALLKENAKQEGSLADKAWQRRKKYAFEKLTDLTLLDPENTYFVVFISRSNQEGDKFSFDAWCSDGAGDEFVTTEDVEEGLSFTGFVTKVKPDVNPVGVHPKTCVITGFQSMVNWWLLVHSGPVSGSVRQSLCD
ncbi:unnamed protein product [Sphagnum jensenii]|uniref:Transposase n=1 Tax=Sphagnum jensenii TaxID=128206 RepID=A0ABP1AV87_9BRYO